MKKARAGLIAAATLLLVLLSMLGCGGDDVGAAREQMKKADDMLPGLKASFDGLTEDLRAGLTALNAELAEGKVPDAAALFSPVYAALDEHAAALDDVKAEYGMIGDLTGVDDYVEYADLRIAQLDADARGVTATREYLEATAEIMRSGSPDPDEWLKTAEEFAAEMDDLGRKVRELAAQATELQKDKKL